MSNHISPYDPIAEMYHTLWADWYLPAALPALERLFFQEVPIGAKVVDVCCGSGHVTGELIRRGYQVTGIDGSAGLIEIARREWPEVDWRVQDVRRIMVEKRAYTGALSTFDSLNHLSSVGDLVEVFDGVRSALEPGGLFVFDINLEEAFLHGQRNWTVNAGETKVSLIRGLYDHARKTACTELIWFVKTGKSECWRQYRSVVEEKIFAEEDILLALYRAGFSRMEAISAEGAGMTAELAVGRIFISARV